MKIRKVAVNARKKCFEIEVSNQSYDFPFSKLRIAPKPGDPIVKAYADPELGSEAFTYVLYSGKEGSVPLDAVLTYHRDPETLRKILLYKLTLKAQKLVEKISSSKREIIRRAGTSPTQFYRLMDQAFYGKTIDQMVRLLAALDCVVDVTFTKAA
jgi:hypothetical protein